MSRIGKKPIVVPANVKVDLSGDMIQASSSFGKFEYKVPDCLKTVIDNGTVSVSVKDGMSVDLNRQYWGTARSIINAGIIGLANKFVKNIDLIGVGYRSEEHTSELQS